MKKIQFDVEYTDTFGGEANYSWAKRRIISVPENATDRSVVIAAKKALGLTGVRFRKSDMGETIRLDEVGACRVVFITYREPIMDAEESEVSND